jgi:RNA 2',3'-cyclic 3'-phosphodiesterase
LIRSFLAAELPEPILRKIGEVQGGLRSSRADVRWTNPEKIHLTLKFFGDIEESRIDPIFKSIEEPVRNTLPFSLKVRGVGAFPHLKNPRVIWIGLVDDREVLTSLQKQIETQLQKIGFQPEDRPFHPHLTLGRMTSSRGKGDLVGRMEKLREEEFGDFQVERVVLFKSDLRPSGPIYTSLGGMRLGEQNNSKEIGR